MADKLTMWNPAGFLPRLIWFPILFWPLLSSAKEVPHWPASPSSFWQYPYPALDQLIQPTVSGNAESGLFGCVRNNGRRFHEGIDIAPQRRDGKGEAADFVHAFLSGTVAHISSVSGNSSYGRYIVLEHNDCNPAVYSLYAHLRSIQPGLKTGDSVQAGQVIGVMGRSASGYSIPRERAHLHFEIGLRLSDRFQNWYTAQSFSSPNHHDNYNGINLVGMDPLEYFELYRTGRITSITDYFRQLPTAFTVHYASAHAPMLLLRYPGLLGGKADIKKLVGWTIDFTWYGLPLRFTPVEGDPSSVSSTSIRILSFNRELMERFPCRQTLSLQSDGSALPGPTLLQILQILFQR